MAGRRVPISIAQRDRNTKQLRFVQQHRDSVPDLVKRTVGRINCSPSSVYNTLNNLQFSPRIIEGMYDIVAEHLGIASAIGEVPASVIGHTVANEHDRRILEQLTTVTQIERDLEARRSAFLLSLREYENAFIGAEVSRSALRTLYRTTGPKLSSESLTMVAEALGTEPPSLEIPTDALVPIPIRAHDDIALDVAQTPRPAPLDTWNEPKPEYEPLPFVEPEPGNTNEDYQKWLSEQETKKTEPKPRRKMLTPEEIKAKIAAANQEES